MRESGCSDVEGMWVMKYSWKQRRWRAMDAGACCAGAYREACAHPRQAIGRRRGARGRCSDGFHMLSLAAATEAWCCSAGSYVMAWVGLLGIPHFQAARVAHVGSFLNQPPVSRLAGQQPQPSSLDHAASPPPLCSQCTTSQRPQHHELGCTAHREVIGRPSKQRRRGRVPPACHLSH
jgi:hypothetical protein